MSNTVYFSDFSFDFNSIEVYINTCSYRSVAEKYKVMFRVDLPQRSTEDILFVNHVLLLLQKLYTPVEKVTNPESADGSLQGITFEISSPEYGKPNIKVYLGQENPSSYELVIQNEATGEPISAELVVEQLLTDYRNKAVESVKKMWHIA
mgnify:CR=1 FL=1